jgi:hypothetical protein
MSIGKPLYFTREHIEAHRGDTSPILAEQVVHCLELLSQMVDKGLSFMFKGGNSLLLLLDKPRRFSIDIDIASDATKPEIDQIIEKIMADSGVFTSFTKREHKTKPWLPMVSYNFWYNSHFQEDPKEAFIMLDVQLKMSGYPKTTRPVKCMELYASSMKAVVPTISSLIGDKLLTLGPATLGIPVGKGKAAQRLKHVCDVATLSLLEPNMEEVIAAIEYCMKQENELQKTQWTLEETWKDTLNYLGIALEYPDEPQISDNEGRLFEVVSGRQPFAEHLLSNHYPWDLLQENLARVALVFTVAVTGGMDDSELHSALRVMPEAAAERLNRKIPDDTRIRNLAERNPMAAWFWAETIRLAGEGVV